MEQKRSARMTAIPQLGIPDILVDDEDDRTGSIASGQGISTAPSQATAVFLSVNSVAGSAQHHRSWSGASMDISLHDTSYAHPLSSPRSGGLSSPTGSSGLQPQRHQHSPSTSCFELQEPIGQLTADSRQRGSAVSAISGGSPGLVSEMLDDSIWVESIRRSATQRRSGRGT